MLDAGLAPSLVANGIAAASWILDPSEKIELLERHWDAFDPGARMAILDSVLFFSEDADLVELVIRRADVEAVLAVLTDRKVGNYTSEHRKSFRARLEAIVARLSIAELDKTSDQEWYARWLMDSRENVRNHGFGCGLVHHAVHGPAPEFLPLLLERGANPELRSTHASEWALPDSSHPVKGGFLAIVELAAGATALDLAERCYEKMKLLDAKYANVCDSLIGFGKLRCASARAKQLDNLERYQQILEILKRRGLVADPSKTAAPKPTYDVERALEQYLALCGAIGQDMAAERRVRPIAPRADVMDYWRGLAEDNALLLSRVEDELLGGLVRSGEWFYDDEHLDDEGSKIAERGDKLYSKGADALYDVDGVIFHVHPEGVWRQGTYDECMIKLRDALAKPD